MSDDCALGKWKIVASSSFPKDAKGIEDVFATPAPINPFFKAVRTYADLET